MNDWIPHILFLIGFTWYIYLKLQQRAKKKRSEKMKQYTEYMQKKLYEGYDEQN